MLRSSQYGIFSIWQRCMFEGNWLTCVGVILDLKASGGITTPTSRHQMIGAGASTITPRNPKIWLIGVNFTSGWTNSLTMNGKWSICSSTRAFSRKKQPTFWEFRFEL